MHEGPVLLVVVELVEQDDQLVVVRLRPPPESRECSAWTSDAARTGTGPLVAARRANTEPTRPETRKVAGRTRRGRTS